METARRPLPKQVEELAQDMVERVLRLPRERLDRVVELRHLYVAATEAEQQHEILTAIMEIVRPDIVGMDWPRTAEEVLDDTVNSEAARRVEAYRVSVGRRIRKARKAKGWTQEQLASAARIPQPHVCRLEQGKHAATDITIQRIADALGVPPGELDPAMD